MMKKLALMTTCLLMPLSWTVHGATMERELSPYSSCTREPLANAASWLPATAPPCTGPAMDLPWFMGTGAPETEVAIREAAPGTGSARVCLPCAAGPCAANGDAISIAPPRPGLILLLLLGVAVVGRRRAW
jgi:hypothetical protein